MKFKKFCTLLIIVILSGCSDSDLKSDWSDEETQALATKVQENEIVLYGYEGCPYCTQAKDWLNKNNFSFKNCDVEIDSQCLDEYTKADGNGVPFLIIKRNGQEYQMRDGFDINELLSILQINP